MDPFYSNCGPGFLQENACPNPSKYEYNWSLAKVSTGKVLDLTRFQTQRNFGSTHYGTTRRRGILLPMGWNSELQAQEGLMMNL